MEPKWLTIAKGEIGQHEIKNGQNPRILLYHSTTSLKATTDEVPWCSSFVNWCMAEAGYPGTGNALASSWLNWGVPLYTPTEGCVCVIKKKVQGTDMSTGSSTGYHVAFWLGEKDGHVSLLGGNQSDQVKVSNFNLQSYEVKGYRMPVEW